MSELCHFNTVQDFWKYFNHLPRPSQVFFDGDCKKKIGPEGRTVEEYSLFKKGIEPEWGDPLNVTGGEWYCRQYFESEVLDLYWQNLVLGLIGEVIEEAVDEEGKGASVINGARIVDKSRGQYATFKIELWLSARDETTKERVKRQLMQVIMDGQPPSSRKMSPKFDWKDHSAS